MGTSPTFASRSRTVIAQIMASVTISVGAASLAPVASAQVPEQFQGMDISGPVSVPAGETTTVDLGVPLNVNLSQNGWTVVSNGTSVSVTAPEGESSIAVPVSYAGQSATVTIISQPGGEVGIVDESAGSGESASAESNSSDDGAGTPDGASADNSVTPNGGGTNGESGEPGVNTRQPVLPRPPRDMASPVDETEAELIELAGEIDGNVLRSKMSLTQAVDVYNKFGGSDTEGLKLRYLDGDGQIIQGVERNIDTASRTLTLTYPADQTPDNPFIIQVVRESDQKAVAVVRITSPGQLTTSQGGEAELPAEAASAAEDDKKVVAIAVLALVAAVALLGGLIVMMRKRKRKGQQN